MRFSSFCQKSATFVFLAHIFIVFILISFNVTKRVLVSHKSVGAIFIKAVSKVMPSPEVGADMEPDFVFQETNTPPSNQTSMERHISRIQKMNKKAKKLAMIIDQEVDDNLAIQDQCIELYGFLHYLMGCRIIWDAEPSRIVYRMDNGNLISEVILADNGIICQRAEYIKEFYSFLTENGIPFLFIQAPNKVAPDCIDILPGIENKLSPQKNFFLSLLEQYEIPYYDIEKEILSEKLSWPDLFYKTDHHWKIETARWVYQKILPFLEENHVISPEHSSFLTDLDNYETIVRKDGFFGSCGWRTGKLYSGVDPFLYYVPKFETNYRIKKTFQVHGNSKTGIKEKEGSFVDCMIWSPGKNYYATYLGGDNALIEIENTNGQGNLLVICDSYASPFCAFVSLHTKNLVMMDARWYHASIFDILDHYQFDAVIILVNFGNVLDYNNFEFFERFIQEKNKNGLTSP